MADKHYLVWQPLLGHTLGAYLASTPGAAIEACAAEFDLDPAGELEDSSDRLCAYNIEDILAESINALAGEDYGTDPYDNRGWRHLVALDPRACHVYSWSGIGPGLPESMSRGCDEIIADLPQAAIPASVVAQLLDNIGLLVQACVEEANDARPCLLVPAGIDDVEDVEDADQSSARYALGLLELEIATWWSPGDWYDLAGNQIEDLLRQGHSAEQIVDLMGTGDDRDGRVNVEAAVTWMTERIGEMQGEAIADILDADDAMSLWEAASKACALHQVPLASNPPYSETAITAREYGHADLADALVEAEAMQTRFERGAVADLEEPLLPGPVARRCYGCDRPIDPRAGLAVVYCGRCGEDGR